MIRIIKPDRFVAEAWRGGRETSARYRKIDYRYRETHAQTE